MKIQLRFLNARSVFSLLCAMTCVHALRAESYEPLGLETLPLSLIHVADYAPLAGNSVAQLKAPPSSTKQPLNSAPQSTAVLPQATAEKSVADSFYFLGDAGVAFTQTMNIANHTASATTGSLTGAKLNLNIGARFDLGVGYQLTDSFALELASGLIWNSVSSVEGNLLGTTGGFVRIPLPLQGGQGNIYNVPFMLNGKFRVPLNKDKTHPIALTCGVGVGGIWSDASVNSITSPKATEIVPGAALSVNGNAFAFAYQANLGLEWQLANHLYFGFGYAFLALLRLTMVPQVSTQMLLAIHLSAFRRTLFTRIHCLELYDTNSESYFTCAISRLCAPCYSWRMYPVVDTFLSLPTVLIVIIAVALWSCIAVFVNMVIVPILCGRDGKKLGKFEAEVTSQIALAFGLLISFNAVWIWDRSDRVHAAVIAEASALTTVLDDSENLNDPAQAKEVRDMVAVYARSLIEKEWPTMRGKPLPLTRPAEMIKLRVLAKKTGDSNMIDAVNTAEKSREVRIRDGMAYMSPSRWGVVFALAVLLLISIGALHGESPRGRKLALALVTLAVSFCFAVLMVHARPFVGQMAIQPIELQTVLARAESPV